MAKEPDPRQGELQQLLSNVQDREWRMNNLYRIRNVDGIPIQFQPNWAQKRLFANLGHRNVVLKVRKVGITTGLCINWLDTCLFRSNVTVGIVADTIDNASAWMRDIVRYAYNSMPDVLKMAVPITGDNATEVRFRNGSSISVGVTYRGTITPQILHVSELGYISQKQPKRAEEIKTGAIQSVGAKGLVVVESTAKGRAGYFFDLVQQGQKGQDWKFFFMPWYEEPLYVKDDRALEYKADKEYLDKLQETIGRVLTQSQRNWWCWKRRELGDEVFSEFPSTEEEAFRQSTEGAYYAAHMLAAWIGGRVTKVPIDRHLPVQTWWDIGRDTTAIWFVQTHGYEIRLVDYYSAAGKQMSHYADYIGQWRRTNNVESVSCVGPHDLERTSWDSGDGRMETARAHGLYFHVVPRGKIADRIDAVRNALPRCVFDEEKCAQGLRCLEHYRKKWNTVAGVWNEEPMHDWACLRGDALILTRAGRCRIDQLPNTGEVMTPCGWRSYHSPRVTKNNAPLVEVRFTGGYTERCTADHLFWTDSGWKFALSLQPGSRIQSSLTRSRSISMALSTAFIRASDISQRAAAGFIRMFGPRHLDRFLQVAISTIAIPTRPATAYSIWSACPAASITACPGPGPASDQAPAPRQQHGMAPLPEDFGTNATPGAAGPGRNGNAKRNLATTVGAHFKRWFGQIGTSNGSAPQYANLLTIESVRQLNETADVWCLTVPDGHWYSLGNGAVCHNSHGADSFGYGIQYQSMAGGITGLAQPSRIAMRPVQRQSWR